MTETEQNKLLFEGFSLGLRTLLQAYEIHIPGTDGHKHWDLLREVAEGRVTRGFNRGEIELKYPNMIEEMKAYLARNAPKLIAKDRELARRILEAMAAL